MKIFIFGSRSIEVLPDNILAVLDYYADKCEQILVGNSVGADSAIKDYIAKTNRENKMFVCGEHYGEIRGECDLAIAIWDGKSGGVQANIKKLKGLGKKVICLDISKLSGTINVPVNAEFYV